MYLIIETRPNLTYAIKKFSQFCYNLIVRYTNTIIKVLRYVVDIIELGLRLQKKEDLITYSNSVYDNNKQDRKFIYRYMLLYDQSVYI